MTSKLKRELQQFLEQERISIHSGIVNYMTYQLADIKVNEEQLYQGFTLDNEETMDKEKVTFSIATGLDFSQIKKILNFFKIPEEKYLHGKPILINDDTMIEYFLFNFKNRFQTLKETSPEIIAQYKALSAPLLEANAKNILKKNLDEVKFMIMANYPGTSFTQTIKNLISFISTLSGRILDLENFPHLYVDVLKSKQEINHFLQLPEINGKPKLYAQLIMLLDSIALFECYHRNESVLSNIGLHKEFKEFLIPYRINPEKCDLLGHVILSLANVKIHTANLSRLTPGEDRARLVITFKNISEENVSKIVACMHRLGDGTAFVMDGRTPSSTVSDPYLVLRNQEYPLYKNENEEQTTKLYEKCSIEVDGNFFHTCVYPKIKENIAQLAAQQQLGNYQETSKEDFKFTVETARVSEHSMFEKYPNSASQFDTPNKKSSRTCICSLLKN
ncbi:hypothetical protein [Legionella longbeachae]|uniref:Uncharacterized protein n=1 Tax=Legionella longbeachae serogroup 1 (strain NSW150) TaxID=661367 RepID=D3HMQ1_LEGLN|nr:hypothetical protein [Legionella longbeachae]VEE04252.1 Uncharacterised protein [Legionella oakridgensis]HBD7397022.1 hypothetical protein [Legionella pneumophila]ARB92920.1 hypothetical protein A6J40_12355 [Legionella longbeachae]EEZ96856.1 hypothetical protein LLB_2054 [Legionella longbeachae D-4968]QIN33840.1 hypothetical protein GCB94_17665 [Legionella longbeachae]